MISDFFVTYECRSFIFVKVTSLFCLLALLMLMMMIIKINNSNGSDCFTRHLQFFVEWQFTIQ